MNLLTYNRDSLYTKQQPTSWSTVGLHILNKMLQLCEDWHEQIMRSRQVAMDRLLWKERTNSDPAVLFALTITPVLKR